MHLVPAELALERAQPLELGPHLSDLVGREDVGDDEVAILVERSPLLGGQRPDTQRGQGLGGVADHVASRFDPMRAVRPSPRRMRCAARHVGAVAQDGEPLGDIWRSSSGRMSRMPSGLPVRTLASGQRYRRQPGMPVPRTGLGCQDRWSGRNGRASRHRCRVRPGWLRHWRCPACSRSGRSARCAGWPRPWSPAGRGRGSRHGRCRRRARACHGAGSGPIRPTLPPPRPSPPSAA